MPTILHLIPTLGGGGAERQLTYLAANLQRLGAKAHVGYLHGGPNLDRLLADGVSTHFLGPMGNYDIRLLVRIIGLIRRLRPHLVQTWLTQMDILGGGATLWHGIPFVLSERTSAEFYSHDWKNRIRVGVGKYAAAVTANSKGGLEYWDSYGRSGGQIRCVIPNAIPFDEIEAALPVKSWDVAEVPFDELVLFAGRMISIKNLDTLIPALISVMNKRPSAVATLLGEGPLSKDIAKTVEGAELSHRLRVLPFSERIFGWLKRASVFVSVSRFEGNPNTVFEAAACGCPLVLSDISAHREYLDDGSARFVFGESSDSIAAGILDTLENRNAACMRAARARERIASYTTLAIAGQYLDLYEKVLHNGSISS